MSVSDGSVGKPSGVVRNGMTHDPMKNSNTDLAKNRMLSYRSLPTLVDWA